MNSKILLSIFICVFLVGCASNPNPVKKPINSGIFNQEPLQSELKFVPNGRDKTLAIMLSENSKATISYLKKEMEWHDSNSKSWWLSGVEDLALAQKEVNNPEFETKYIVSVLKQHFGKIDLINSINEFSPKTHNTLAVIDILRGRNNGWSSFEEISNVHTSFFDQKLEHIATAGTNYKETIPHENGNENYTVRVHQVIEKSLKIWESEVAKVMSIAPKSPESFDYNECMRTANSLKDKSLKSKAIEFCISEQKVKKPN